MRIPFAVEYSQARSKPISVQRVLNLYSEQAPANEKTPVALYATPGLTALGPAIDPATIRGLHVMGERLYAVAGTTFYAVDAGASALALGTVPGDGPVFMADNGTQCMIVNNSNAGYIGTTSTLVPITDTDFPGAGSVTFIDTYFVVNQPGSRRFYISAINDGLSWDALEFAAAEADPDFITRVFADHRELWLFGTRSIEIWSNTGASPFPFERISGAFIERGTEAPQSVAKCDNSIFWLGDDGIVYRANGYTPARVSTHAIELLIDSMPNVSEGRAYSYTQEGHTFYVLTFPNNGTIVFDVATGLWHERQTFGRKDWATIDYANVYGRNITGSFTSGLLYELDLDNRTENGQIIRRQAVTPSIWGETQRVTMSRFQVDFEMGTGMVVNVPHAVDLFIEDNTANVHQILQSVAKPASVAAYVGSIYVKQNGRNIQMRITNSANSGWSASFNPATGVIIGNSQIGGGAVTFLDAQISGPTQGFFRCALFVTSDADTSLRFSANSVNSSGAAFYTGDGASGWYAASAMLSQSSVLLPYEPVGAVPTTNNLLTFSDSLSNAIWVKSFASITSAMIPGPFTPTMVDPQAMLDWSDDGGKTWSNEHWVSIGLIGKYKDRAMWRRLGQFRQRNFRVTVSDPVVVAIAGAYTDMAGGSI